MEQPEILELVAEQVVQVVEEEVQLVVMVVQVAVEEMKILQEDQLHKIVIILELDMEILEEELLILHIDQAVEVVLEAQELLETVVETADQDYQLGQLGHR